MSSISESSVQIRNELGPGSYQDEATWPQISIKRIAFAHIDCDWYDPVKYCLEAVADKLDPGGGLLIDDYNDHGGAHAAVDEVMAARPDFGLEAAPNPMLCRHWNG